MPRRAALVLAAILAAALLAACGTDATDAASSSDAPVADTATEPDPKEAGGAAGMCAEGVTDCIDTPELLDDAPVPIDETGVAQARRDAEAILGSAEGEIGPGIRIARRGAEELPLDLDHVVGRITAELDDVDGDGVYTVTSTTVELPEGTQRFPDEG